jgi:RND family efflux transporter MFP subunit
MDDKANDVVENVDDKANDVGPRSRWPRHLGLAALAVALVAAGAAGGVLWSERRALALRSTNSPGTPADPRAAAPPSAATPPGGASPGGTAAAPLEVSLTPEAVARIGLQTAVVRSVPGGERLVLPASIVPNAYRDTKVNALVGGIVRAVPVELGTRVATGQTLAIVGSQELAEAQMKYLSMQATLEADHLKLRRTEKLVELGSASRQEMEEITAVHTAHATEVAAARERLLLLGLSRAQVGRLTDVSQIVSEVRVVAPAEGVVTARAVNPGQVVMAGQELFVVADVGTVWAVGEVYERDMAHVRDGAVAEVTAVALPGTVLHGRVSYIDPRVDPVARTTKVRVEIANPRQELRFGMYVTMGLSVGSGAPVVLVPRSAIQPLGETSVVYLPLSDGEGRFVERPVTLGVVVGDAIQVLKGLKPGDRVVTEGSFFLRAEAARFRSTS